MRKSIKSFTKTIGLTSLIIFWNLVSVFSANLFFSEETIKWDLWCEINWEIRINTKNSEISASDIVIEYDENFLNFQKVEYWNSFWINFPVQKQNKKLYFTSVSPNKYISWEIFFAKISFIAKSVWSTELKFATDGFGFQNTKESNLAYDWLDLLKQVKNTQIIIWDENKCISEPEETKLKTEKKTNSKYNKFKIIFAVLFILFIFAIKFKLDKNLSTKTKWWKI